MSNDTLALNDKICRILLTRTGGRVVYGSGLENRRAGNRTVGSNPTLSAKFYLKHSSSKSAFYGSIPISGGIDPPYKRKHGNK